MQIDPVIVVGGARVFHGDCIEVLKGLPENSVDSIVTDPPYGLEFMGKDWDAPWKKSEVVTVTDKKTNGVFHDKGFKHGIRFSRGKQEMVAFQLWATEWAVECLRVLKPGGHILAFGGSRTWHRLAVAVEDAGFELRDSIAWIYGSGFPKSLDVSKAIDKRAGAERQIVGQQSRQIGKGNWQVDDGGWQDSSKADENGIRTFDLTAPATSEAKQWEGWGTALKPAFEPVVVGRKPFGKGVTVAENVLLWGVGGLNIDGSRIAGDTSEFYSATGKPRSGMGHARGYEMGEGYGGENANPPHSKGRWPANVILDEVTAGLLDEQSGERPGGQFPARRGNSVNTAFASGQETAGGARGMGDSGGASRFFYVAKASRRDRNEGLEELEAKGSGTFDDDGHRQPGERKNNHTAPMPKQNFHPTVKPTALMRYLIKLVTPEGGVVLDPFTGSGSTGKAALLDGFQFVGVELTEEYLPIIEGRLRWASEQVEDDGTLF
jgi:site-specific DNA-methyltransferase (adenine-specific)